jgi:2-polyprenyl-3-methyl-5-hydroxy-6-metoxy-1,4-benzoquinol methylase
VRLRGALRSLGPPAHEPGTSLTSHWLDERALESLRERYREYQVADVSYATVADFVDSFENLNPLACAQGDLKDVQRPWVLKTVLSTVPRGGRILEIGGGQPYVADLLSRLGYEMWLVDPYDGSGNGPVEFEMYRTMCPSIRFVRSVFDDRLSDPPQEAFDCVLSISVLEHIDHDGLDGVFRGLAKFLTPNGVSVHAIDHVHRGRADREHLEKLRFITSRSGLSTGKLDMILSQMESDTETYYLSAESHNRWRGSLPYNEFPMRICVSIQLVSWATALQAI